MTGVAERHKIMFPYKLLQINKKNDMGLFAFFSFAFK